MGALELATASIAGTLGGMLRGRLEEAIVQTQLSVHWLLPLDQELIVHVQIARRDGDLRDVRVETQVLLGGAEPLASTG